MPGDSLLALESSHRLECLWHWAPMTEADRERAIRLKLAGMPERHRGAAISTGFAALDASLGEGGIPSGTIVELFGPPSCGKTTLVLQMVAHLQNQNGSAAWIDAEHAFDAARAASLGVVLNRLPVIQPGPAEEALEIARRLAASHGVDLLVVDSAAALVPSLEMETGIGEGGAGLHGRILASGLRRLALATARTGAVVVFLNQTRSRPDPSGGESETTAGGAPLKLYAAVRIGMEEGPGGRVRFRILKNKFAAAFRETELEWQGARGFVESP